MELPRFWLLVAPEPAKAVCQCYSDIIRALGEKFKCAPAVYKKRSFFSRLS
jgi:hypothetical protein